MQKKTLLLFMCLCVLVTLSAQSQNFVIPQTEFSISTVDSVTIEKGSFKKLNVWVLRSKSFADRKIKMRIASALPEGVVINFQNQNDYFDMCEVTVTASPQTKPGTYYIILSGSAKYLSKGRALKLKIEESSSTESVSIGG